MTWSEADIYSRLWTVGNNPRSGLEEDLRTAPLMTLAVKEAVDKDVKVEVDGSKDDTSTVEKIYSQYAVLGFHTGDHTMVPKREPILMNLNAPNSAFICGSQGSGKSYTLSCMLENCLLADKRIGQVHQPLAGLVFHYDLDSAGSVAETAYLCSMGIKINVLVSQSNEHALRTAYSKIPGAKKNLSITPLLFRSSDLSFERMHRLMAFAEKQSAIPLYMSVALRILRQMAIDARGGAFIYEQFRRLLDAENLTRDQLGPLNLRLELLESFLDLEQPGKKSGSKSLINLEPGSLTIIDLTDPFVDPATACVLFDICLSLVKERRPSCGLVVALDEAHKYMTSSPAASNFTERLLGTIREQRHNATRVIIATQEPTISEKLLDLCSVSIIHRFTSPAWFTSIQGHLGAASKGTRSMSERHATFEQIMDLQVGESLVFAPSAFLCLDESGTTSRLGGVAVTMRTRTRLGIDGGMSVLTSTQADSRTKEDEPLAQPKQSPAPDRADSPHIADKSAAPTYPLQALPDRTKPAVPSVPSSQEFCFNGNVRFLNLFRSYLVLICCDCDDAVAIEFQSSFLPAITGIKQENMRAGLAYATCITCQLDEVEEKRKALQQFDYKQSKDFRDGEIEPDDAVRHAFLTGVTDVLGRDITVFTRGDRHLYLMLKAVHRAVKSGDLLYSLELVDRDGSPSIEISEHEDGCFFKASLQPQNGNE